jgi:hypothetical protein
MAGHNDAASEPPMNDRRQLQFSCIETHGPCAYSVPGNRTAWYTLRTYVQRWTFSSQGMIEILLILGRGAVNRNSINPPWNV